MERSKDKTLDERRSALAHLIALYCARHHDTRDGELCETCADLLAYAAKRAERCTHDPKPKCKACGTHCYGPDYAEKIKAVMRGARAPSGDGGQRR
jgi:hypothetical protein